MASRFIPTLNKAKTSSTRPQDTLGKFFKSLMLSSGGVDSKPNIPKSLRSHWGAETDPKILQVAELAMKQNLDQKIQLKKVLGACRQLDSGLYHIALEAGGDQKQNQQFYLKAADGNLEEWLEWKSVAVDAFENYNVKKEVPVSRFSGKGLQAYINAINFGDSNVPANPYLHGGAMVDWDRQDPYIIGLAQFAVDQYNSNRKEAKYFYFPFFDHLFRSFVGQEKEPSVQFKKLMGACHYGDAERLYHIVLEAPDVSKERKFYAQIWVHRLLNLKQLKKWSEWIPVDDATEKETPDHEGHVGGAFEN